MTKEQFIIKAIAKHGHRFNYSKVVYINNCTNVIIICPIHGEFKCTPANHLKGTNCPKCSNEKQSRDRLSTTEEFIQKANLIHNNKYDYSKVVYIGCFSKIIIICPIHGEFQQNARDHLRGYGCSSCGFYKIGNRRRSNLEEFVRKARLIHGNKYDYSKVVYINGNSKVIIICPIHGEFEQTPGSHLYGNGCSNCSESKGEQAIKSILVKHKIVYEPQYNISEIVANYKVDFYLPEYRCLIEFHGIQHYEYIPFFHDGNYTFEDQKNRDDLVRDAAIRWKYNYLEFNYKQLKYMTNEEFETLVINKINRFRKR